MTNLFADSRGARNVEQALMRDRESDYDWDRDGQPIAAIVEDLTGLPEDICEKF